jgi:hypothetical protein
MDDEFWNQAGEPAPTYSKRNRIGALNMALLFGTAAIALTLILTPVLAPEDGGQIQASTIDYDNITTGSIPTPDGKVKRYTIRRSILQDKPGEVCIINPDGSRNGC